LVPNNFSNFFFHVFPVIVEAKRERERERENEKSHKLYFSKPLYSIDLPKLINWNVRDILGALSSFLRVNERNR
jgi:hypothetical protein